MGTFSSDGSDLTGEQNNTGVRTILFEGREREVQPHPRLEVIGFKRSEGDFKGIVPVVRWFNFSDIPMLIRPTDIRWAEKYKGHLDFPGKVRLNHMIRCVDKVRVQCGLPKLAPFLKQGHVIRYDNTGNFFNALGYSDLEFFDCLGELHIITGDRIDTMANLLHQHVTLPSIGDKSYAVFYYKDGNRLYFSDSHTRMSGYLNLSERRKRISKMKKNAARVVRDIMIEHIDSVLGDCPIVPEPEETYYHALTSLEYMSAISEVYQIRNKQHFQIRFHNVFGIENVFGHIERSVRGASPDQRIRDRIVFHQKPPYTSKDCYNTIISPDDSDSALEL